MQFLLQLDHRGNICKASTEVICKDCNKLWQQRVK